MPAGRLRKGVHSWYFNLVLSQRPALIRIWALIEKTVFLSYRHTNVSWALAIFQDLTQHGYDAFFDFMSIASGDFERVILENIMSRAHFIVLLTPSALERCGDPADSLRREIETGTSEMFRFVLSTAVTLKLHGHMTDFEFALEQDRYVGQYSVLISIFRDYRVR